jgi:hypothetical protein
VILAVLLASTATAETEQKAFTEVGSHTWQVPSGVEEVKVLVVGGGGGGSTDSSSGGCGGDGGSGIVLIKYNGDFSICDRRGPQGECISNSTHSVDNQHFNISSLFQSESTAEFNSLTGTATINVTNRTRLSGLWRGGFEIFSERTVIRPGADFRPENNRIIIGK